METSIRRCNSRRAATAGWRDQIHARAIHPADLMPAVTVMALPKLPSQRKHMNSRGLAAIGLVGHLIPNTHSSRICLITPLRGCAAWTALPSSRKALAGRDDFVIVRGLPS